MPTELEELVEFLHHGNTEIRQVATENLVPYSRSQPTIFKTSQLQPVKDLKLLIRDYAPIAKNALTILINVSSNLEVLKLLAEDDAFLETILGRITRPKEPNADDLASLLANLAKSPSLERLITLERPKVPNLSPLPLAITQLIELFNRGANGGYNKDATYNYLAYLFADLSKYPAFVTYLTTPPSHTSLDPLTTFLPHTTSSSKIRRLGTASLLKNIAFIHPDIPYLLQPAHSVLPPLLLALCSSNQEGLDEEEMEALPEECQYLTSEHQQEEDNAILKIHLETLLLLSTRGGVVGRRLVKERGTYPIIRELHLQDDIDDGVRRGCERLVDIIMSDEPDTGTTTGNGSGAKGPGTGMVKMGPDGGGVGRMVTQDEVEEQEDDDDDDDIVPIF